jgi:putative transposase
VNYLKGVSSRMLRKEFPELAARGAHLWTPSYFAAPAGGTPIERLREYGEAQEKPS